MMPPKQNELTLEQKVGLIQTRDGKSQGQLAQQFGIGRSKIAGRFKEESGPDGCA